MTITKATYNRKFIGGLQFQRVSPWLSLVGGIASGRQAGRHGAGIVAESLHLIHKHEAEKELARDDRSFWRKPATGDVPPPTRPLLQILPKQFYQLRPKHSNIWACGGRSHSMHHALPTRPVGGCLVGFSFLVLGFHRVGLRACSACTLLPSSISSPW